MQKTAKSLIQGLIITSILITSVVSSSYHSPAIAQVNNSNPGAIWTTDVNCHKVNGNLFTRKEDVYLNGGPDNSGNGASGLPDGKYFVKVTDPNGSNPLGHISNSSVTVTNGKFDMCYNLYLLTEFTDTPNAGGVYKVWASQNAEFPDNESKTDNFKIGTADCNCGSASPSPSASGEVSPSPSASAEASTSPSPSASAETSVSPSPSIASSATPAPSNNNNNNSNNNSNSNSSNNSGSTEGQILGATYGATGVATDAIMNALGSVGGLMTVAGSVLYGQKKRSQK